MKILLMGDIHGNLPALEKLFRIERDFDLTICHGDVVNYGPWSNECVQLLQSQKACQILKGNHEEYFLGGAYGGTNSLVNTFFQFCHEKFTEDDTIAKYGGTLTVGDYTVSHTIFDKYVFLDTHIESLNGNYIIGHSHQQFDRRIGDYRLVNTGSLGQNRKYINISNYAIFDTDKDEILLRSFSYDVDLLINKMASEGYPKECIDYYASKARL